MDTRISEPYISLIEKLLSLNTLASSKKEIVFINQCIEQIEKIAILRSKLSWQYHLELETEIAQLNKIEAKFQETLYSFITYSKIIQIYPELESCTKCLASTSCFMALAITGIIFGVILGTPLTPLAGLLLCLALASTLFIFQANSSLITQPSPVLFHLQETYSSLMQDLKRLMVGLDRNVSLLEDKLNFREKKSPDLTSSRAEQPFLTPPASPTPYNYNHLFKTKANNHGNSSISIPTLKPI
jgi:hypothetical protein